MSGWPSFAIHLHERNAYCDEVFKYRLDAFPDNQRRLGDNLTVAGTGASVREVFYWTRTCKSYKMIPSLEHLERYVNPFLFIKVSIDLWPGLTDT